MKTSVLAVTLAIFPGLLPAGADPQVPVQASGPAAVAEDSRLSRLQGSASLGRNRHVVGATVLVQPKADPSRAFLTSSDAKGRFRVEGLPDGAYRVEVRRLGLEPAVKDDVSLKFPFRSVVELPMRPSVSETAATSPGSLPSPSGPPVVLRGGVLDHDGVDLAEIRVRLVRADGRLDPREVLSSPEGRFEIDGLATGVWRLEADGVGFLPVRIPLNLAGDTDLRVALVLQPAGYDPSPLELMPREEPVAPAALEASLPDY